MKKIQVGFLVSYDYELLKIAIPQIYKESDSIFLAIDKQRKTWKGETFEIKEDFFEWIKSIDVNSKIEILEDNFYHPELTSMQCEVLERKALAEKMGIGNWLIQLDADEYFLDFKGFVDFLRSKNHYLDNPQKNQIQISPYLINLYKRVDDGILYVERPTKIMVATNFPSYRVGRQTRKRIIYYKGAVLHECISRTKEELEMKFNNWGHDTDINKEEFLEKWETVNESNYKTMRNFFYMEPEKWKKLAFVKGTTFNEIEKNLDFNEVLPSGFYIWKKNFGQWFKHLTKK
ncbi:MULTISPECIES: hypothetical protein [Flavobacterium]|uniref:Glycosyl transferase family 2 n=1 Tax=Flavobacterium endoglycinae TaxID=2816357 RepID=A0ABX7QFM2_9FLAO|nr:MULTISPECIES: hypothetical protein [Flavobacterium]QSW89752.1 hypothetical protein J0383_02795 [Flavobacterium endoglycinae]